MSTKKRAFDRDEKQDALVSALVDTFSGAGLNGSGTGVGKTVCAVRAGVEREAKRVLIIAQPKVFENFAETLEILTGEKLRPCSNAKFRDTPKAEAQANKAAFMAGEEGWFFVSRELFQRETWRKREVKHRSGRTSQKVEYFSSWDKRAQIDFTVYDECQMAASAKSKSSQSLRKLKTEFLLLQSGDWFGGLVENQYHIAKTLWPEWLDSQYKDFAEWRDENCVTEYDHFAYDKKRIVGEKWPGFFASSLPLYVRIASPIEKPEPERHYIDLLPVERKLYNELNKNMAAEIEDELLVVELNVTLHMRLRELALGMFRPKEVMGKDADGRPEMKQTVEFVAGDPSSTVEEIREIRKDHPGEPIIVLTHSAKFARKCAEDLGGLSYTGAETDSQKAEAERAFMAGECDVLVGTDAMCEGLDGLQRRCRIAIIASRPGKNYMTGQFIGRIARRGQEREPLVYEIVRRQTLDTGTVDKAIEKALMLNKAKAIAKDSSKKS